MIIHANNNQIEKNPADATTRKDLEWPTKPVRPGLTPTKVRDIVHEEFRKLEKTGQIATEADINTGANAVIAALQKIIEDQNPRTFIVNARWQLPPPPATPLPQGYVFYAFLTFTMIEENYGEGLSQEEVKEAVLERRPGIDNLTVTFYPIEDQFINDLKHLSPLEIFQIS